MVDAAVASRPPPAPGGGGGGGVIAPAASGGWRAGGAAGALKLTSSVVSTALDALATGNPTPYQALFGSLRSPAAAPPHLLPPLLRGLAAHALAASAGHPATVALVNLALAIDHGALIARATAAAAAAPAGSAVQAVGAAVAEGVEAAAALALTLASASASYVEASALSLAALLLLPVPDGVTSAAAPPTSMPSLVAAAAAGVATGVAAAGTTTTTTADPVTTAICLLLGLYPRTGADAVRRALGRRFPHHRRSADVLSAAATGVLRLATALGAAPELGGWAPGGLAADCVRLVVERAAAVDAEAVDLPDLTAELLDRGGDKVEVTLFDANDDDGAPVEATCDEAPAGATVHSAASGGVDVVVTTPPPPSPPEADPLAEKLDALLLPLLQHTTVTATSAMVAAAAYDALYTAWASTSSTAPAGAACHWALAAAAAARPGGAATTAARLRAVAADAAGAPAAARAAAVRTSAALVARAASVAEVRSWLTAIVGWTHAYVAAVADGRRGGGRWEDVGSSRGGDRGVGGDDRWDTAAANGVGNGAHGWRVGRSSAKRRRLNGGGGAHDLFYDTVEGVALVLVRRGPSLGAEWVGRLRLGTVCASRLAPLDRLDAARRVAFTDTLARLGVVVPGSKGGTGADTADASWGVWSRFPLEVCGVRAVGELLRERRLLRDPQAEPWA
ncbi:hypothetical protein MMPV_002543 [Pyropia vietnamensis]